MSDSRLLILIPAYNEEARIGPTLQKYGAYFRDHYEGEHQILVVLNGCRDKTSDVVQRMAKEFPTIRMVIIEAAVGKGGALIEGLKRARDFDYVGYTDADASTDPKSFFRLVELCVGKDCVVGSRRMPDSVIHQAQPTKRLLASRVFHLIVATLFGLGIRDTQCGAKVMRREAAERILPQLHIADMAFDINLLYALKRAGFQLFEAPVEWTDDVGTTVRYFRTSLVMFVSVVRLRLVYSPFRFLLSALRPIEPWIYRALRSPPPAAQAAPDSEGRRP